MREHQVALWAGVGAFFGSLLAIGIFDVINPGKGWEYLGALVTATITAGSVYAKQRYEDAKKMEGKNDPPSTLGRPNGDTSASE